MRIWLWGIGLALLALAHSASAQNAANLMCLNATTNLWQPCSAANPLPTASASGSAGGAFFTYNAVVAVTGTAVQLSSSAQTLSNGLSCFVIASGSNKVSIGASNAVTNPQSVSFGGSAVGTYLVNGQGWAAAVSAPSKVWFNGTAGDGVTCWGN